MSPSFINDLLAKQWLYVPFTTTTPRHFRLMVIVGYTNVLPVVLAAMSIRLCENIMIKC